MYAKNILSYPFCVRIEWVKSSVLKVDGLSRWYDREIEMKINESQQSVLLSRFRRCVFLKFNRWGKRDFLDKCKWFQGSFFPLDFFFWAQAHVARKRGQEVCTATKSFRVRFPLPNSQLSWRLLFGWKEGGRFLADSKWVSNVNFLGREHIP